MTSHVRDGPVSLDATLLASGDREGLEDSRVVARLEQYMAGLEAGRGPDRAALLEEFPAIADELAACLDALDVMRQVTPEAGNSADEPGDSGVLPSPLGTLGDFQLVREIGRGGMGVVYEAQQISLRRRVALKLLPFAAVLDPRQLQRFKNEAMAAASLDHPNIVSIYSVGCERGVHYYAMQYIEGQTLAQVIDRLSGSVAARLAGAETVTLPAAAGSGAQEAEVHAAPDAGVVSTNRRIASTSRGSEGLPGVDGASSHSESPEYLRSVARLAIQAALALDHAHQMGIVHRDIKPSNLLLNDEGHLWITDFGLAMSQSGPTLTAAGDVVGTLAYMSPEQVQGNRHTLDSRTDIYSLGVTLYELVTLRPPFVGGDRPAIARKIVEQEPVPPRRLNRAIPVDLETIILKATAKEPAVRYGTARQMAEDLERFLDNRPILARRASWTERLGKWSRRHTAVVWSIVVVLLIALAATVVSAALIWVEREQKQAALDQAQLNFRRARGAVDDMLSFVGQHQLRNTPQMEQVRAGLLESALVYYEQFLRENRGQPALRFDTGKACLRMAEIEQLLGRTDEAQQSCRQAVALFEDLCREFPTALEPGRALGKASSELALLFYEGGQLAEAERACRRAIDTYAGLAVRSPILRIEQASLLSESHTHLAMILSELGRTAEAEDSCREAIAIQEGLLRQFPATMGDQQTMWRARTLLGMAQFRAGRLVEAEGSFQTAFELARGLVSQSPEAAEAREPFAASLVNLGVAAGARGDLDEATELLRASFFAAEPLCADFPTVPQYAALAASSQGNRAIVLWKTGCDAEAEAACRETIERLDHLAQKHAGIRSLARQRDHWGGMLAVIRNEGDDAPPALFTAQELNLPWLALPPAAAEYSTAGELVPIVAGETSGTPGEAEMSIELAWVLANSPDPRQRDAEQAVELAARALGLEPRNPAFWTTLGLAQYRAGRWQAATQAAEKATLLGDAGAAPQLVRAMAQWRLGQKAEAERAYQAVLDQVTPEAAAARDIDWLRREAARLLGQAPPASQGGTLP